MATSVGSFDAISEDKLNIKPQDNNQVPDSSNCKVKAVNDDDIDEDIDTRCGWKCCRPRCGQVFSTPVWLCACLSAFTTVQGMVVNGFVYVSITSLEKRFELSSTLSGLIASSYDIAAAILVLFVSYFGAVGNKPRYLATGCVVMGIGSLIFALPHFTTGLYEYERSTFSETCTLDLNSTVQDCRESKSGLSNYVYVFILGQLLHGMGATPLYTLGTSFQDESVSRKSSGFYIGIILGFSLLGPGLAYLIGGRLLYTFVDFDKVDPSTVSLIPEDPSWVGAWWVGFLISSAMALLVAMPMSLFPRKLPGSAKIRAEKVSEAHQGGGGTEVTSVAGFGMSMKDFPTALKMLICNAPLMLVTLAGCSEGLIVSAFAAFMPKFVENQFGVSAGFASVLVGIAAVPGAGGGVILGGYFIKRFNWKVRGIIKFCIFCTIITIVMSPILLMRCPLEPIAGIYVPYNYTGVEEIKPTGLEDTNLTSPCNADCQCSTDAYVPVCGSNDVIYFDACHAGCQAKNPDDNVFYNCSCISEYQDVSLTEATATSGVCNDFCVLMPVYVFLFFVIMFFNFCVTTPVTTITLRCVPESQRAFALGFQLIFLRILGTIPGPILFGIALDSSCILWQTNCGQRGSCLIYDNFQFGLRFFLMGCGLKVFTLTFCLLCLCSYKAPPEQAVNDSDIRLDITKEDMTSAETGSDARSDSVGQTNAAFASED
ncbi:solute carrier organic anion transporter family member 4C1-like [Ptychodera flava]|uniref:solute carrier organic anion transporter family member 4C1-like n=1 Tax=Ptychodera flava TaxID=63121 RepID=UPI00396AA88F